MTHSWCFHRSRLLCVLHILLWGEQRSAAGGYTPTQGQTGRTTLLLELLCSNITFFFFFTFLTESSSCQRKETSESFSLETERLRQQNQNQSVSKCLQICEICVWQSCTGPTLRGENREIFNTENYQMANLFCVLVKQQGHRIRIHLPHIPAGIHSANTYFQHVIFKLKKIKVFDYPNWIPNIISLLKEVCL